MPSGSGTEENSSASDYRMKKTQTHYHVVEDSKGGDRVDRGSAKKKSITEYRIEEDSTGTSCVKRKWSERKTVHKSPSKQEKGQGPHQSQHVQHDEQGQPAYRYVHRIERTLDPRHRRESTGSRSDYTLSKHREDQGPSSSRKGSTSYDDGGSGKYGMPSEKETTTTSRPGNTGSIYPTEIEEPESDEEH